jgi:16S rRNA (adenine1518-N6/adenine1519-N6)-dimethyltransferase
MKEHHHSDLTAKKSLGQNFLTSDTIPRAMVAAGSVDSYDTVVEIGPGTGALTAALLATGAHIITIETDDRAIAILHERFSAALTKKQLTIVKGDVRDAEPLAILATLPPYKVVANIPYYLSGFLLRTLLEHRHPPTTLVFLMQKEVVTRIARDKKASLLSLSVATYGTPTYVRTVSRGHFSPQPNVDSAILLVDAITSPFATATEKEHFFRLLHLGFGQKRKQLVTNLSVQYDRERILSVLATLQLPPTVRAEDVPLTAWQTLVRTLPPTG